MRKFLFLFLFLCNLVSAQEEVVHSVYFEFDKFNLDEKQANDVVAFVNNIDTTRIESIQIYGYCDDRGKDAYNYKLSNNRANTIKNKLIEKGIKNKIIVTIEGKGRVLIEDDIIENLPEVRQKNRRVDVLMNFKPAPIVPIPGVYNDLKSDVVVGDRICFDKILFDKGRSVLTHKARVELDRIARFLHKYKNIHFEIQGHICCTPTFQREAIDKDTKKRALSHNRAQAVYKYLVAKRIEKKRMTFKGYGNTQPLGNGAEQDRRVEFLITKI